MTSKPAGSLFKHFITPVSGSEFYHSQPVVGRRSGHGLTTDVGHLGGKNLSRKGMLRGTSRVSDLASEGYPDVVLLRPKAPMTEAQKAKFQIESLRRSHWNTGYDPKKAVKVLLHDMFVPKIKGVTDRGQQQAELKKDLFQNIDKHLNISGKPTEQVVCSGNVCSTVPAQAMEAATGKIPVPGKRAQDVFPSDFLRSGEYELVGSRVKSKYHNRALLKAAPYLMRAGVGVAGAGAVYGASENPEAAGAVGGALGTSALASFVNRKLSPSMTAAHARIPSVGDIVATGLIETPFSTVSVLKRWAARRLPILAAGGAAGWYGTKKIREYLSEGR